jgi:hypothetical protein
VNDQEWDDYIRQQPGTFFGERGREHAEMHKSYTRADLPRPSAPEKRAVESKRISGAESPHDARDQWSTAGMAVGFLLGAGIMLTRPEPSLGAVLFVGMIGSWLLGRLYKLVGFIAVLVFVFWIMGRAS